MTTINTQKPKPEEHSAYHAKYIDLVPAGCIIETLKQQLNTAMTFFGGLSEQQALHRYAPEKWSIKEVLGHINDGERIFAYRALRFSRNDKSPLAGFDQDVYVANSNFDKQPLTALLDEYEHLRKATIDLFKGLEASAWDRRGIASQNEISVRAIAWVLTGHELHHLNVIRTKYL